MDLTRQTGISSKTIRGLDDDIAPIVKGSGRFQILALSGGGYRGLFTAAILERLETDGPPLRERFDMVTGTSIGAIIAGAISVGIASADIRKAMEMHGSKIFPKKGRIARLTAPVKKFFEAAYQTVPLEKTIDEILGDNAWLELNKHDKPLLIPCVSHTRAEPRLLRSKGLAGNKADAITLKESMLASAAAPTYFPPILMGTETVIDGGIVANAPDAVALCEAMVHMRIPLDEIHILSIGTASKSLACPPDDGGSPGTVGWLLARSLFTVAMAAQERLAIAQCSAILGDQYLRVDTTPSDKQSNAIALDKADYKATKTLLDLADACHRALVSGKDQNSISQFLGHRVVT